MSQALAGIKVADFTISGVGPFTTKYLADHGASVVKVESATYPDIIRVSAPYKDNIPGLNRSGTFIGLSSSKYSLALNLNRPQGVEVAKRLVAWADVMVESFAPGTIARLGLGYEVVREVKSDIIMLSTSQQGQTGPRARHPGWGWAMKGLAGFVHLTGWPDREPSGITPPYTDMVAPWFAVVAIMSALDYRHRTGKGQYIDLSQMESSLHFLAPALLDYTVNGRVQHGEGNRSSQAAPHGVYRCRGDDRWCAIAVFTDQAWTDFCRVLGEPKWGKDPKFATLLGRLENADELEKLIEERTINYSPEELMTELQLAGVAAGVVETCEDVMDKDPQLKHRGYFQLLDQLEIGYCRHQAWPAKLLGTPPELKPAPRLGEHTEYVCTQLLRMSDEEFISLMAEGIFE